jgi:hypothetical protein
MFVPVVPAIREVSAAGASANGPASSDEIAVPPGMRVLVATKPLDFRRGADCLAAPAASGIRGYRAEYFGRDQRLK